MEGGTDYSSNGAVSLDVRRKKVYPPPYPPWKEMEELQLKRCRSVWIIPTLLLVNTGMFVVSMGVNNCPRRSPGGDCVAKFLGRFAFEALERNPTLGPSSSTLYTMGALDPYKTKRHHAWRLFTCIWLHGGLFHLLINLTSLVFIGVRLEQEFGCVKVSLLYLFSGVGGSLVASLFLQSHVSVGASATLFGLLGSMISDLIINWAVYLNKCSTLFTTIFIIIVNLATGLLPHIDNFAHIGGLVSGFLFGFILLHKPPFIWGSNYDASSRSKRKICHHVLWVTSFTLLLTGFAMAVFMLSKGINLNKRCSWCHYLNCVPTSRWNCGI